MPLVQDMHYSAGEAQRARESIGYAEEHGGGPIVRAGRAGAVWRVLHVAEHEGGIVVRLEPVDPHDVPIRLSVQEMPLPRGPQAGTLGV